MQTSTDQECEIQMLWKLSRLATDLMKAPAAEVDPTEAWELRDDIDLLAENSAPNVEVRARKLIESMDGWSAAAP